MDQCSQLSIEFDRLGLTDLLEGISVAGDRFYLVEHLFASGKVNQEYRNGAPGPARDCGGGVRLTAGTAYLPNVFARDRKLTIMRPITLVQLGARYLWRLFNQRIKFVQNGNGLSVDGVQMKRGHAKGWLIFK